MRILNITGIIPFPRVSAFNMIHARPYNPEGITIFNMNDF